MIKNKINIMKWYQIIVIVFSPLLVINLACKKQNEWLEKKRDISEIVPTKLTDFQSILDNGELLMNLGYASLGLMSADNHYIPDANINSVYYLDRNCYIWSKNLYEGQ